MKRILLTVLALVVLAGTVFLVPVIWFKPWTPDLFYARMFLSFALRHPVLLTQMGMLENTPFRWYADDLEDISIAAQKREAKLVSDNLAMLRSYDRNKMKPGARLSADVLEWFLADQQAGDRDFMFHDYPVNQLFGVQNMTATFMLNLQPLKQGRDAKCYVTRVSKIPLVFDQCIDGLAVRESLGVIPPRFVLRRVITEMTRFIGTPPDSNPLYTHFAARLDSLKDLSKKEGERRRTELRAALESGVYPAYRRMIAKCEALEAKATDDDGVWKLPNGDAYYDYQLRHHTTTDLSADSIHAIGLREIARIQAQMKTIMKSKHMKPEPFGAAMHAMRVNPEFGFPDGDEGRKEILARYQSILDDASQRCDALFDVRPRAPLKVERVPAFTEATAPGAYYNSSSMDGSRPGVFYANLRNPRETRRPDMRTLAYHEGIPGHHFQLSVQQELKDVAFFRKIIPFTAYAEGWGLYAERLALESGFHQDAYDSLGALGAELFRAVRLVVDTGIHREHWTRQQAIDYMITNTGLDTAGVVSEIERYIVAPGQACAYKVGQLKILELRERAKARLGDHFDIKKFHDVVLTNGALPLTLLERVVDDWIASEEKVAGVKAKG